MLNIKIFIFSLKVIFLMIILNGHASAFDNKNILINQANNKNKMTCPSLDFSKFIKVFSENIDIQIGFTKYPLKYQRLDLDAAPEPKPIFRNIKREKVSFPVIPNKSEIKRKSFDLRIKEKKSNHAQLTVSKQDTDYQINYIFHRKSCWRLQKIEDWSL
jgi:hypothetical protein